MAAFLDYQLGAAGTLKNTARLFVHLMNRGLLQEHKGLWQLHWMTDDTFLAEIEASGVPAPCCAIAVGQH